MTVSMFDQMLFHLPCRHQVVLGRLDKKDKWTCEDCGKETILNAEPFKSSIEKDIDTAHQIDLQEMPKGH
jgi:hypothetical protein